MIWYRSRGGDVLRAGKVTVGLELHWPRVTDFSGLSAYGLTAQETEMSTPPTFFMEYRTPLPFYLIVKRVKDDAGRRCQQTIGPLLLLLLLAYRPRQREWRQGI